MESWFTQAVEKILETKWYTWAVLVVLVVAGTAVLIPVVCRGGRRPGE